MDCFPFSKLIDFSEGVLEPSERQALLDHMVDCPRCREETDFLKQVLALMRSDRPAPVPDDLLHTALGFFDRLRGDTIIDALKKKITAVLAFDSFQQPAMAGIRNTKGLGKQLLFKAEDYDIDLRFSSMGQGEFEYLIGQVLRKDEGAGVADVLVSLATEDEEVLLTTTDAFGIFSFRKLPPQRKYDFKITMPGVEIHIGDVSPC